MFKWSEAITELTGFVFSFLATGATGFRLFVLRARIEPEIFDRASGRAAILGLIGAAGNLVMRFAIALPQTAARQHTTVLRATVANAPATTQSICAALALIGFGLALSRVQAGWAIAAAGVIVSPFAPLLNGQWVRVVNPIHRLAGGFWIGTLFVLLIAGFVSVLNSDLQPSRRGELAAEMVHSFSPLALTSFVVLAIFGVITAWRHLKRIESLWTTWYGYALIAKLCVVIVVITLGAWNWRRQRPLLGSESAAAVLRPSATAELIAATVVLVITSILVSLPSPK